MKNNITITAVSVLTVFVGLFLAYLFTNAFLSNEVNPFLYSCDSEISEECKTIHKVYGQVTQDRMCILLDGGRKICGTQKLDNDWSDAMLSGSCRTFSFWLDKPIRSGWYTEQADLAKSFYISTCIEE